MKNNQQFLKYSLLAFFSYFCLSCGMTQLIPLLQSRNCGDPATTVILSGLGLVSFIIQLICSWYFVSHDKYKILFTLFLILYCVFYILMYTGEQLNAFFIFSLLAGLSLVRPLQGILDVAVHRAVSERYSLLHCFSSVGWAVGSVAAAWILHNSFSALSGPVVITAGVVCLLLLLPVKTAGNSSQAGKKKGCGLKVSGKVARLILAATILYFTGSTDMILMSQKMMEFSDGARWLSWKFAIQSLAEIPLYLTADRLLEKYPVTFLYRISAIMFAVRFLAYSFLHDPLMICLVSSLQMVTLPLAVLCQRKRLSQLVDSSCQGAVLMLSIGIYTGISQLLMPISLQFLQQILTMDQTLAFLGVFSLSALFLIG